MHESSDRKLTSTPGSGFRIWTRGRRDAGDSSEEGRDDDILQDLRQA